METSQALREQLVESDDLLVAPGCFDAMTAGIIEALDFDAMYLGGWSTGASMGVPEPQISLTKMCDRGRDITMQTDLPLVGDGKAGYGNAKHTKRAVKEYADAGFAGLHIEDQEHPRRPGYTDGKIYLTDVEEMVGKIEAAVEGREEGDDIVIMARTDAAKANRRGEETIEDAIQRVNRYFDAGAEVGVVFPDDHEEAEYAVEHAEGPLFFSYYELRDPTPSMDELDEMGYGGVDIPTTATCVAARAVYDAFEDLAETGQTGVTVPELHELLDDLPEIIDLPRYRQGDPTR